MEFGLFIVYFVPYRLKIKLYRHIPTSVNLLLNLGDMEENEFGLFWIEEDILFFEFKPGMVIDILAAQQIVIERLRVQYGKSLPILCDVSHVFEINKEARDYFAHQGSVLAKAVGIVAPQNSLSFTMASFYLKVNRPQVLTKIFSNRLTALQFLKTFV